MPAPIRASSSTSMSLPVIPKGTSMSVMAAAASRSLFIRGCHTDNANRPTRIAVHKRHRNCCFLRFFGTAHDDLRQPNCCRCPVSRLHWQSLTGTTQSPVQVSRHSLGGRVRKAILFSLSALLVLAAVGAAPAKAAGGSAVVGLRRLTEQEYRNSIADIFGKDIAVQGIFEPGKRIGGLIEASSAILSFTPVGFDSYS